MTRPPAATRIERALAALAIDPGGLKGMVLRVRMSPVRQAFETALGHMPGPIRRIHPQISDTQLFGGLNIAASLAEGRPVRDPGVVETPALLVLAMAERTGPDLAARLSQLLDADAGHAVILLDEGASAEEAAPRALQDRLAFHVEPEDEALRIEALRLPAHADLDQAQKRLTNITIPADSFGLLIALAARFGIDSLRAPLLALRAARALTALDCETTVSEAALLEAAELVYPSRATLIPETESRADDAQPEAPTPPDDSAESADGKSGGEIPDEILVQAIAALLPPDLLDRLKAARAAQARAASSGAGSKRRGNRRGRPLPSRPGRPSQEARIDPVATLRSAAPWQRLRRTPQNAHRPVIIHPTDIRLRRFEDRSDRLLIFTVDASGSAAVARLAEAKGAVELMLAQAYARRDHVALLAFRGEGAELLLPPTRSLVQAKRQLSSLPGGGGTPLAAGLVAASELASHARGRGMSPTLVLLTDGRANVPLKGDPDRAVARSDAETVAASLARQGIPGVLVDTSNRPADTAREIAARLGADYLALPRADAHRISASVSRALEG